MGGHLYCIVQKKELWPLSRYPMYSHRQKSRYAIKRFYGVADGKEFRLSTRQHLAPFDPIRLLWSLGKMNRGEKRQAGRWLVDRYEALRQHGRHDGPPIVQLRVYRETWKLTPELSPPRRRKRVHTFRARRAE